MAETQDDIQQTPLDTSQADGQPPFQNLIPEIQGNMLVTPGAGGVPSFVQPPSYLPTPEDTRRSINQANMDRLNQEQGGFLPTAMAIFGLLKGDVRPMMQLEEQKRRTAFAQAFAPINAEVNSLTNQGKFDDAINLMTQAAQQAGARNPEVLPFMQATTQRIAQQQVQLRDIAQANKYFKSVIDQKEAAGQPVTLTDKAKYQLTNDAVKSGSPFSQELLRELWGQKTDVQISEGQAFLKGPSGDVTPVPLPGVVQHGDVNDEVGQLVAAHAGLENTTQLQNVLNNQPVTLATGQTIQPNSLEAARIKQMHGASQVLRYNIALGKMNPQEAAVSNALRAMTVNGRPRFSETDIATGNIPPDARQQAINDVQNRQIDVAIGPIQYQQLHDPNFAQKNGQTIIDLSNDIDTFGNPINQLMTQTEFNGTNGRLGLVPTERFEKTIQPTMQQIRELNGIQDFVQFLGKPETKWEQGKTAIGRWISDYIGRDIQPGMGMTKAAEVFIERKIEDAARTMGASDAEVGRLKSYIVGKFQTPEGALQAVQYVQQQLLGRIRAQTGKDLQAPGISTPQQGQAAPTQAAPTPASQMRTPQGTYQPSGASTFTPGPPNKQVQPLPKKKTMQGWTLGR